MSRLFSPVVFVLLFGVVLFDRQSAVADCRSFAGLLTHGGYAVADHSGRTVSSCIATMMNQHKKMDMKMIRYWYGAALLSLVLLLGACGSGDTPEEQVKLFVAAGEAAVEARDIGDIKALISEKYSDDHERTRRDLVALSARYIYANKNIHLLTRIGELTFPSENSAQLQLYVAMTGQNVSDLDALLNMQAELYRFEMELVREDKEWKLLKADWQRARGEDFF